MQRWTVLRYSLLPELKEEVGGLTPKLEKLIHLIDWIRLKEFVSARSGTGRPRV